MKTELEKIKEGLRLLARRRQWFRAWNGLFKGLFFATALWLFVIIAFKILPLPEQVFDWMEGLVVLGMLCGFFVGWQKRETELAIAQWVDHRLGLKEKLSAAIEFSRSEDAWRDLLIQKAAPCVSNISPKRLLTYRLPLLSRWIVCILLVSVGLGFVPEYRTQSHLDQQRQKAIFKEAGRRVSSFVKHSQRHHPPQMKPTQKTMISIDDLGKKLSSAKLTRADALGKIESVTDKVRDQARTLGEHPAISRMRKLSQTPLSVNDHNDHNDLQEKIRTLENAVAADPDSISRMKKGLKDLHKAASELAEAGGISPELKQQLDAEMSNLLQQMKDHNVLLPELEEALTSLKNAEIDRFLKSLESAEINLDKLLKMAKTLNSLKMELAEKGKDLGEQFEKGQVRSAQNRILEMAKMLRSGNLSSEDLKGMMSEISEAISPSEDYGAVKEKLAQALKKGRAGERMASAKSLSEAAKELENLMGQMGDLQSLLDSLQMLQKAQMSVGNCQSWGAGQSAGGFKPGGKAGSGVGTWANEGLDSSYFPQSKGWDNSGIIQPEMAPRGHSDRDEGRHVSGMKPSKIKGQFTPGAPMPSITLKGVSIRGESQVKIQEEISAAQSSAQRALSQQKVPRAYRQAVKSYFDDFEK